MYVKHVVSNLKGGVNCTLGEHTLIVGPNATGKSSVIAAIELALSGAVTDVAGREQMAKDSDLLFHLVDEGELVAKVELDDGSEARWVAGAKGAKRAQHSFPADRVDPDRVFPLAPAVNAVTGNPLTARKFFLAYVLPHLTREDVLARIPASLHGNYRDAILKAMAADPEVDKLLLALENSSAKARGGKVAAKAQTAAVGVATEGLAPLPTEAVIDAVKVEQKAARKALEGLIQARAAAAQIQKTQADAAPIRAQLATAQQNISAIQATLNDAFSTLSLTPKPEQLTEHVQRVMAIIERCAVQEAEHPEKGLGCPICKQATPPGAFAQRHQAAQAYKASEEAKSGPYLAAEARLTALSNNLAAWQQHAVSLETQLTGIQQVIAVGAGGVSVSEEAYNAAQERVSKADAEATRLETLKAQWETASRVRDTASDSDKEGDKWAELAKACADALDKLLGAGINDFVAKVQGFLPPKDHFGLSLVENKKPAFRLGLTEGAHLRTALSGAEWSRVMAAVAAACITPGKLAVVIPPDRSFDPHQLTLTLHAFSAITAQVIIATTTVPEFIPAGWTVIDTSKGQHKAG